jgi:hypothetical protein
MLAGLLRAGNSNLPLKLCRRGLNVEVCIFARPSAHEQVRQNTAEPECAVAGSNVDEFAQRERAVSAMARKATMTNADFLIHA